MGMSKVRTAMASCSAFVILAVPQIASAGAGDPPNFVPELRLSYTDPENGEVVACGDDCRRFSAPSGVVLEVRVVVGNNGGSAGGDGVTWDLWFNQPTHPFPGLDILDCYDQETFQFDRGCWQALIDRADLDAWSDLNADRVCIPLQPGDCRDEVIKVVMDPDFAGARKRGVYHFGVWVDRFQSISEFDEFDNYVGPVRVTVDTRHRVAGDSPPAPVQVLNSTALEQEPVVAAARARSPMVVPSQPKPYSAVVVPAEVSKAFSLTSASSRSLLEFIPRCAGRVSVEVSQTGAYEIMKVEIRKVSTGEVVVEAEGKGRLVLRGGVDNFQLKDDPRFEVKVIPGRGSRGIRGTIVVSYPAELRYMVDQGPGR